MTFRVLVVDDSLTLRQCIVDALSQRPEFEVVGEAEDGKEAIELCKRLKPDVMTLDMMMPGMSGLAVTEFVMAYCPVPILIVSASTNRGELFQTYEALAAGAVDVLDKVPGAQDQAWENQLAETLQIVARVKVITHIRARLPSHLKRIGPPTVPVSSIRAVAIGASTGGPGAVLALLKGLPRDFPVPILLVLHLGAGFGQALAEWLDESSPFRASFAVEGQILPPLGKGVVLLAPPDQHLTLERGRLHLDQSPERHFCRPSVDTLFESVADDLGSNAAGCLLTGMGRDGAHGLLALRESGAYTIAQDEATCVVYGMPREAARINAANHILPLGQIAPFLTKLVYGGKS